MDVLINLFWWGLAISLALFVFGMVLNLIIMLFVGIGAGCVAVVNWIRHGGQ